ncbi:hypothetical protein [Sphingobium sp.]|uniref:hypothetical protein n=1 Tax=Sphingobium sp. TaxID=1912891 RepID=UPI002C228551|nr:hypothetical protein [Sphingobium sp.]HUD93834.1 hypothetical protein [Sphingobium sp.]
MDAAATVQTCPQAYEVFAPASKIPELVKLAKAKKWQASAAEIEPGDVGRFTIFVTQRRDVPEPFSLINEVPYVVRSLGGYTTVSQAKPQGLRCELPSWISSLGATLPKAIFFEVRGNGAEKLNKDAISLGLNFSKFAGNGSEAVFRFSEPSGLSDKKIQSIYYRMYRGDYGDAELAIGMSRAEIIERGEAKWGRK